VEKLTRAKDEAQVANEINSMLASNIKELETMPEREPKRIIKGE
jgi:hypothetical protein